MKTIRRSLVIGLALLLLGSAAIGFNWSLAEPSPPPDPLTFEQALDARVFRLLTLTPAARTINGTLPIDGSNWVMFNFGSNSNTLSITLTSPNGQTLSTTAGNAVIYPELSNTAANGYNYTFSIDQPSPGVWSYQVVETASINSNRAVLFDIVLDSPVQAGIVASQPVAPLGRPMRFGLLTVEDQSIKSSGLAITTKISRLDDLNAPPINLTFLDDGLNGDVTAGDGFFTATFMPTNIGQFYLEADISGTNTQGQAFLRNTGTTFTVTPLRAVLTGTFSDRGIDDNSDGLLDRIGIAPGLTISTPGNYSIAVTLQANNNATITAAITQTLSTASTSVEVFFPAEDLRRQLQVDGPYTVSRVALGQITNERIEPTDERFNLGNTAAYQLSQLIRPNILLRNGITAVGIDSDSNGRFNFLDINLPLTLRFSGTYTAEATLRDSQGNSITSASSGAALAAGDSSLALRFDGRAIGNSLINGPYTVTDLLVYGTGSNDTLALSTAFTTQALQASQFERNPLILRPGASASGVDTDGNGKFNFLEFRVPVNVQFSTSHAFSALLRDSNNTIIAQATSIDQLNAGEMVLVLRFAGADIVQSGLNGPYLLSDLAVSPAGYASTFEPLAASSDSLLASNFDAARIFYVAPGGTNTACLSGTVPCASIGQALAQASNGDSIVVMSGTYTAPTLQNITIDKSVALFSSSGDYRSSNTILDFSGMVGAPIALSGNNIIVQGFTFRNLNDATYGALFISQTGQGTGPHGLTIRANRFEYLQTPAIVYLGPNSLSNLLISDNWISNIGNVDKSGIFLLGGINTGTISNNTIANTTYSGILIDGNTSNLNISGNLIRDVPYQGIQIANVNGPYNNVVISNNRIERANTVAAPTNASRGAIRIYGGSGTIQVLNNVISDSFNGVAVRSGSAVNIVAQYNCLSNLRSGSVALYNGGSSSLSAIHNWAGGSTPSTSGSVLATPFVQALNVSVPQAISAGDAVTIRATARDSAAATVPNLLLSYRVTNSGGSVVASGLLTTNASGEAAVTLTDLPAGTYTISFNPDALIGPVNRSGCINGSAQFVIE